MKTRGRSRKPPICVVATVGARRSRRLAARNESWVKELSPEIQELIVQHLGVVSITRLCQVSRHWRRRAEASGWDGALPELDPLHLIGRPGFQKLHASLGSWELVARKLAEGNRTCNYCGDCDQFFCPDAEFEFILPNRWVFDATVTAEVHGDGSQEDGQVLREAIADAEPYATLLLSGAFLLDDSLDLDKPIRLLGKEGEGASIRIWGDSIIVASAVLLKNLTIYTTHDEDAVEQHQSSVCFGGECAFCDDHIYAQGGDGPIAPAISVRAGGHERRPYLAHGLIGEDLSVTSTIGSAVILGEGTSASFTRCAMHSHMSVCDNVTMCLGVMANSCSTLSMSECTLSRCRWGVFAGEDGMRLEKNNRFLDNEDKDITVDLYPDQPGIIVEPWRAGAANMPSRYTSSR
jgi:hypothetical protein